MAIEAKAGSPTRPKISRGARSFLEAYRPACFAVVNGGLREETTIADVAVRFCRPWELDEVLGELGDVTG